MMKWMGSATTVALTMCTLTASAQASNPQVAIPSVHKSVASTPQVAAPSAHNLGAGISGFAGSKHGPTAQPRMVDSGAVTNLSVAEQDSANVKGVPGGESGPAARVKVHGGL
jgi:hypothetical protein